MTASKADAEFRDWYRDRYGVDFGSEGNIRLVPMDLREAWAAARSAGRAAVVAPEVMAAIAEGLAADLGLPG